MMKLPSVYANKIEKNIKNNTDYFYGDRNNVKPKDLRDLKKEFDSKGYVNRLRVLLTMKDGSKKDEKLVLLKNDGFINLSHFDLDTSQHPASSNLIWKILSIKNPPLRDSFSCGKLITEQRKCPNFIWR